MGTYYCDNCHKSIGSSGTTVICPHCSINLDKFHNNRCPKCDKLKGWKSAVCKKCGFNTNTNTY